VSFAQSKRLTRHRETDPDLHDAAHEALDVADDPIPLAVVLAAAVVTNSEEVIVTDAQEVL
jgi:multisubunit Na+/H+ antiporter MnhC subunit